MQRQQIIRKLLIRKLTVLLALVLMDGSAWAIEWLPEFQSMGENVPDTIETPIIMEPEYQSDVNTYTKPLEWEFDWLSNPMAMDLSFGSISAKHFLIEQRVKIFHRLNKALEFRFHFLKEGNFERDDTHAIIELIFWPLKKWGLSLYGEPELYKRKDDVGVALIYQPSERHEIRLFNTFVDLTRLKRNDKTDTFIEPDVPAARGLVGRVWWPREEELPGTESYFEYAFRWEPKTRWSFPDELKEIQYSKKFGSLGWITPSGEFSQFQLKLQGERKVELHESKATGATFADGTTRDRGFLILRTRFFDVGPSQKWEITAGLTGAYRNWAYASGSQVRHINILPHLWWAFPAFGHGVKEDKFVFGLDMSWHQGQGPAAIRNPFDASSAFDERINIMYEFNFSQTSTLRLIASGDLDEMGSKHSWEGGCAQMKLVF